MVKNFEQNLISRKNGILNLRSKKLVPKMISKSNLSGTISTSSILVIETLISRISFSGIITSFKTRGRCRNLLKLTKIANYKNRYLEYFRLTTGLILLFLLECRFWGLLIEAKVWETFECSENGGFSKVFSVSGGFRRFKILKNRNFSRNKNWSYLKNTDENSSKIWGPETKRIVGSRKIWAYFLVKQVWTCKSRSIK